MVVDLGHLIYVLGFEFQRSKQETSTGFNEVDNEPFWNNKQLIWRDKDLRWKLGGIVDHLRS